MGENSVQTTLDDYSESYSRQSLPLLRRHITVHNLAGAGLMLLAVCVGEQLPAIIFSLGLKLLGTKKDSKEKRC